MECVGHLARPLKAYSMTRLPLLIAAFSLALLSAVPALANHTPAHAKSELVLKSQCDKLTPVAATKNTKGVAYNKAHPDVMQADGAMMSDGEAIGTKKN